MHPSRPYVSNTCVASPSSCQKPHPYLTLGGGEQLLQGLKHLYEMLRIPVLPGLRLIQNQVMTVELFFLQSLWDIVIQVEKE